MGVNYTPSLDGYSGVTTFRFWCQKVIPLVYDDSLSYYELLNKVVNYLNNVISDVSTVEDNMTAMLNAYNQLQQYVNDYFDNLDVDTEIDAKLDAMAASGELSTLISPFVPELVSDWLDENVTPVGSAVIVDSSLSISGAAADAKVVGDKLEKANTAIYEGSNGVIISGLCEVSGHYEANRITIGARVSDAGVKETGKDGYARTNILNGASFPVDAVGLDDDDYCFKMSGYSAISFNNADYVDQTEYVCGGAGSYIFRNPAWSYCCVTFTHNPVDSVAFTQEEITYLANKLTRYVYNESSDRLETAEADIVGLETDMLDRTTYEVDVSDYGYSYGGVGASGKASLDNTRIRIRTASGLAAFNVLAGSTITPNAGYKINVALYSEYVSNDNFTLLEYYPMRTTALTIPTDGYIRIGVGTTNDDVLWTVSDNVYALTQNGINAYENGVTLNFKGGTVKSEIANIWSVLEKQFIDVYQTDEIPLNALGYHGLWANLMSEYPSIQRSLIANANSDSNYPIYLYSIRCDMDYLDGYYNKVPWDGSNELYKRPKIFISCGIHGSERGTPMALYEFVKSLFTNTNFQRMRNAFDWYIMPLCNPWGFSNTAYNNGAPTGGSYNPLTDTFAANTESVHIGIRQNIDGVDCNRCFPPWVPTAEIPSRPIETQAVMTALTNLTTDNVDFVFAMDMHQAWQGSANNAIGAFMSMNYDASDADKNKIYSKWLQSGAITEKAFAELSERANIQSVYAWDGTSANTLRNYLGDYADYATCFEGGIRCQYYGGTTELSNPVARAFACTQLHNFMTALTEIWM